MPLLDLTPQPPVHARGRNKVPTEVSFADPVRQRERTYTTAPLRLLVLGLLLAAVLAACGASPKGRAADLADRFPTEFGDWELDENRLELTAENQSNNGHVTLRYENGDETRVDISIDVYATSTAADVEMGERLRNWELMGIRFERLRPAGYDVATLPGGYLAYLQDAATIITLSIIPPLPAADEAAADAETTDSGSEGEAESAEAGTETESEESTDESESGGLVDAATIEAFQELILAVMNSD